MKKAILYVVYGSKDVVVDKDVKYDIFKYDDLEVAKVSDLLLNEVYLTVGTKVHDIEKFKSEVSLPIPYLSYMLVEYKSEKDLAIYKDVLIDEYNSSIEALRKVAWGIYLDTYGPETISDGTPLLN